MQFCSSSDVEFGVLSGPLALVVGFGLLAFNLLQNAWFYVFPDAGVNPWHGACTYQP